MRLDSLGFHISEEIRLEDNSGGEYIGLKAHATTTSYTLTMPSATGTADQILKTDGSGNLSWTSSGGGGSKGQKGQTGASGTNGTNGTKGQKGQAGTGTGGGSKGQKGQKGASGAAGTNGSDGAKGTKGE